MLVVARPDADARQTSLVLNRPILIKICERDTRSMLAEGFRADTPNFFLTSRLGYSRRQITEHLPASILDDAFRHVQDRGDTPPIPPSSSRIGLYEKEK
jgi:hypothetical protein